MARKKYKKLIKFWKSWEGTILDEFSKEEQKRIQRRYNNHREKSNQKGN